MLTLYSHNVYIIWGCESKHCRDLSSTVLKGISVPLVNYVHIIFTFYGKVNWSVAGTNPEQ